LVFSDTHTHLYLKDFTKDKKTLVKVALDNNVPYLFLPNVDSSTINDLINLCDTFPEYCYPMIGVHPTSINDHNVSSELKMVQYWLAMKKFVAIGEIGIDLYWDKTYFKQQKKAFIDQVQLAIEHQLPISIHSRDSLEITLDLLLTNFDTKRISAVFHCYSGNVEQAKKIVDYGWSVGIGGVVTYKNSILPEVVKEIPLSFILLETDAPYLAPVPYRGKQNSSEYIPVNAAKVAELKNVTIEQVAEITTNNALTFFKIPARK